jgi:uncharacterized protein (DUF1810 family)
VDRRAKQSIAGSNHSPLSTFCKITFLAIFSPHTKYTLQKCSLMRDLQKVSQARKHTPPRIPLAHFQTKQLCSNVTHLRRTQMNRADIKRIFEAYFEKYKKTEGDRTAWSAVWLETTGGGGAGA